MQSLSRRTSSSVLFFAALSIPVAMLATACGTSSPSGTGASTVGSTVTTGMGIGAGAGTSGTGQVSTGTAPSGACGINVVASCDSCISSNCCSENQACAEDSACISLLNCISACSSDMTCENACISAAPSASAQELSNALSCWQSSCSGCSGSQASSSATTGSSSSGVPTNCGITFSTPACTSCIDASCCSQNETCHNDPDCASLLSCISACGSDMTCENNCVDAATDAAAQELDDAIMCWPSSCPC